MQKKDKKIIANIISILIIVTMILFFVYIFSPILFSSDLIVLDNIVDVSKKGDVQWHQIEFQDKGFHYINLKFYKKYFDDIEIENYPWSKWEKKNTNLRIEMECYQDNKLIVKYLLGNNVGPLDSKDYWGYTLKIINVPDDIPLRKKLRCKFEVIEAEEDYSKKYGVKGMQIWRNPH
jgi:hypothetical protein